ncbi:MAG: hypothetical protein WBQ72_09425 [Terriglobales bacterium]
MKPRSLMIIVLLVLLSSFASSQTFGFASVDGSYLYCNYEVLAEAYRAVWEGVDILILCGGNINGDIVGTSGGISASGNPAGFVVKGVTYADDIYDAFSLTFTGLQWYVVTDLKCSTFKNGRYSGKYGWIGFAVTEGIVYGDNYGYLSCQLTGQPGSPPFKDVSNAGATTIPAKK